MSRTVLVVCSSLVLALAGCAEHDASVFPDAPDAGGARPDAGGAEDDDGPPYDDEADASVTGRARPDAPRDAGTRRDPSGPSRSGIDAGGAPPARPVVPGSVADPVPGSTVGSPAQAEPTAATAGGAPSIGDASRTDASPSPPAQQEPPREGAGGEPTRTATESSTGQAPPVAEEAQPAAPVDPGTTPPAPTPQPAAATSRAPLPPSSQPGVRLQRLDVNTPWTFLDLESGTSTNIPFHLPGWDLAMYGTDIMLNGGQSGDGGVIASVLRNVTFEAVTAAPALTGAWGTDAVDGNDSDRMPDFFMSTGPTGGWARDAASGTYTPKRHVYVVRSAEGAYFKLALLGYYDDDPAQTPGFVRLQWAAVAAP